MSAIGSMRKKLAVFNDDGEDDYGSSGMYFNPSMFPPHRPEKEVNDNYYVFCVKAKVQVLS